MPTKGGTHHEASDLGARSTRDRSPAASTRERPELVAYYLWDAVAPECAPISRDWMDATRDRFAYRCLPMVIANQSGWIVANDQPFEATWDGGDDPSGTQIRHLDENRPSRMVTSHFGAGVITWSIPYLFRTPPGYNLLARGPANWPKDGVQALEGIVETDWSAATFTMNWKLTRANHAVRFEAGDPICMIVPQRRGELESFVTKLKPIAADPGVERGYHEWAKSRDRHLKLAKLRGSAAHEGQWQKHYFRGQTADGALVSEEHQTRLKLSTFTRSGDD